MSRRFLASTMPIFIRILNQFQYLHPQVRVQSRHVLYETSEWMTAFNLYLGLASLFDCLNNWLDAESSPVQCSLGDDTVKACVGNGIQSQAQAQEGDIVMCGAENVHECTHSSSHNDGHVPQTNSSSSSGSGSSSGTGSGSNCNTKSTCSEFNVQSFEAQKCDVQMSTSTDTSTSTTELEWRSDILPSLTNVLEVALKGVVDWQGQQLDGGQYRLGLSPKHFSFHLLLHRYLSSLISESCKYSKHTSALENLGELIRQLQHQKSSVIHSEFKGAYTPCFTSIVCSNDGSSGSGSEIHLGNEKGDSITYYCSSSGKSNENGIDGGMGSSSGSREGVCDVSYSGATDSSRLINYSSGSVSNKNCFSSQNGNSLVSNGILTEGKQYNQLLIMIDHTIIASLFGSQIRVGMWRKNGISMTDQLLNYMDVPYCKVFRDLDILLLQFCYMQCGVRLLINHILKRYQVWHYATTEGQRYSTCGDVVGVTDTVDSDIPKSDQEFLPGLLDESLLLLINIVTDLPLPPSENILEQMTVKAKREIIHFLAGSNNIFSTFSQLQEYVNSCHNEFMKINPLLMENIINDVADKKENSIMEPPYFVLKKEMWLHYDPSFSHITSKMHQTASEKRPKNTTPTPMCPPLQPCHSIFNQFRTDLLSAPSLLNIVRNIMYAAAAAKTTHSAYALVREHWQLKCSGAEFDRALQLLTITMHLVIQRDTIDTAVTTTNPSSSVNESTDCNLQSSTIEIIKEDQKSNGSGIDLVSVLTAHFLQEISLTHTGTGTGTGAVRESVVTSGEGQFQDRVQGPDIGNNPQDSQTRSLPHLLWYDIVFP